MAPSDRSGGSAPSRRQMWDGLDHGSVMTVEVLAGVLLWGGIGWLVDRWIGTEPWLGAVGVLVGFAAGLYLVVLRANRMDADERDKDTSGSIGGDAARLAR
jgi:F0F1-type ATP synthase assembly protein I